MILSYVNSKYADVTETSDFLYDDILKFRINIFKCYLKVMVRLDQRVKKREDYYEKSSLIFDVFEDIAKELLKILRELFDTCSTDKNYSEKPAN